MKEDLGRPQPGSSFCWYNMLMPRQPEGRLVRRVRTWLIDQGAVVYKIHGGDNYQEEGIPDLLCCLRGVFVGIELKQEGEKPSKAQ